jgi:outer membrane protein OmpA-like peptidoglycan-associated protein
LLFTPSFRAGYYFGKSRELFMCKNRLFAVVLGVLLTVSGYAQTNQNQTNEDYPKAGFFFGAGMSSGIFTSDKLEVYSDFDLMELNPVKIGAYYELPLGIGNFFAGLEAGYASGSSFGGIGAVDLLPINLNATFAFGIMDIIYIGPSLKAGILGILGHEKYNLLPLLGAGLDLELRYKYFPLSVYAQGGVNAYPTTNGINILPTVEAGLRFPRGAFGRSGQSTQQSSTQSAGTAPASGLTSGQGVGTQPVVTPPPATTSPPVTPVRQAFQFVPTATSRIITLDDGRQGLFSSVYFEPDTGVLIERYRPVMEEAGRLLAANPQLQLVLRTYTALFGTAEGRRMVSIERGNFCRDYFMQNYGVASSRITIEPYGSEREPASARTDDWVSYRCAELIIWE